MQQRPGAQRAVREGRQQGSSAEGRGRRLEGAGEHAEQGQRQGRAAEGEREEREGPGHRLS